MELKFRSDIHLSAKIFDEDLDSIYIFRHGLSCMFLEVESMRQDIFRTA